ncbi:MULTISPECIES: hypothetical protein [Protofrankia]|uniref:Uncharacterized protein n=1 Tax=Protofrankia coriariae TaxID=1562887 RepID=A0ABR5F573_9ACTN|nr:MULTISPECIES: hypothetical protein [Protofrankia]KLL11847.1 hypothetical protein FrCorBMG51_08450 [Protofrankia coriariae]ONH34272.1 hypothetical protein BL254_17290 [Protofrankia sp. BMG5.30]
MTAPTPTIERLAHEMVTATTSEMVTQYEALVIQKTRQMASDARARLEAEDASKAANSLAAHLRARVTSGQPDVTGVLAGVLREVMHKVPGAHTDWAVLADLVTPTEV